MFEPRAAKSRARKRDSSQDALVSNCTLLQVQPIIALNGHATSCFGAGRAASMNRNIEPVGSEPFGHRQPLGLSRQMNIKNALARVAIEMAVLSHIRAKMRRSPVESHLPDQSTLDQSIQAIINSRH